MRFVSLTFLAVSTCFCSPSDRGSPITLDQLAITVSGHSREVAYTNKQAGYYYTETNAEHRTGWQGWHVMQMKIMDDYAVTIGGKPLLKAEAKKVVVLPHQLQREYPNGLHEVVTLVDSLNGLVVDLTNIRHDPIRVAPMFSEYRSTREYVVRWDHGVLLIAKRQQLDRKENFPVWIAVTSAPGVTVLDKRDDSIGTALGFSPAQFLCRAWHSDATIVFAAAGTSEDAAALARDIAGRHEKLVKARRERMEKLLNRSYFWTDDARYSKALNWAKISMDALLMDQLKKGIFAGLPWFDNYWGRDSYISLPGAALVTGGFDDAKEILRSFAGWQDTSSRSVTYGRIPNLVTVNSIAYNTADGTPWFTIASRDYIRSSGDVQFAKEIYPVIRLAITSTRDRRTDVHRFLTHADAETWMDAVGPDGPWSPRGNRANDIQALWYHQLLAGAEIAALAGDSLSARQWNRTADTVRRNFNAIFVRADSGLVYDHLMADGAPDLRVRPNQLFTLDVISDSAVAARVFKQVTERLVYPHGVASLWQDDPDFHPYHHYEEAYVQDAAYHNGIVWTWLAGRWIDAAVGYGLEDLAFQVTQNMTNQILERGAVGTLSELLDAAPRPGEIEPRLSGAFSQAWSLAEFIRTAYQSYLGVRVDATIPRIVLRPGLPSSIHEIESAIPVGRAMVSLRFQQENGRGDVTIEPPPEVKDLTVRLELPLDDGTVRSYSSILHGGEKAVLHFDGATVLERAGGRETPLAGEVRAGSVPRSMFAGLHLAVPHVREDLKALRLPTQRLLSNAEIKRVNQSAQRVYEAEDPEGDDTGSTGYRYPLSPALKPGSLDLRRFEVRADSENDYFTLDFTRLSNPGWHPEYGFQLTFVAIAIDKDGINGSGTRLVGRNAAYTLDSCCGYEEIIFVGGGIRVEDKTGAILAEYRPSPGDEKNPLGRVDAGEISFAIPTSVLGNASTQWNFTVLVGAQDDHGGAGIGEFRTVSEFAGEWVGGGKKDPHASNIYDVLLPRQHR